MTPNNKLKGQVILLTGATGGLGAPLARQLASEGAEVILLGRNVSKLTMLYDELLLSPTVDNIEPKPAIYPLDFEGAVADDYRQLGETLLEQFGKLDALVHLAADFGRHGPLEHQALDVWAKVLHINITASLALIQACLPALREAVNGRILLPEDSAAANGQAFWGAYGISRGASSQLAQMLAAEFGQSGTVSIATVEPGTVATEARRRIFPASEEEDWLSPEAAAELFIQALS